MLPIQANICISINTMKHKLYSPTPQFLPILGFPSFSVLDRTIGYPFQILIVIFQERIFNYGMLDEI